MNDDYTVLADIIVMFLPLLAAWILKHHFITLDEHDTE